MQQKALTLEKIIKIAKQVVGALKAMHDKGIIHRDIKPDNIMVRPDGKVTVIDFGIARLTENWTQTITQDHFVTTEPETVIGSVYYMSPEQIQGQPIDHRTDFFSLGVVLYEMVTNQRPFKGNTFEAVKDEILKKTPERLDKHCPEVPPKLQQIVTKLLSKKLDDCYKTAGDLLADLQEVRIYGEESRGMDWKIPAPLIWVCILVVGTILGFMMASFVSNSRSGSNPTTNGGLVSATPCPLDSSKYGFEQSTEKWVKQIFQDSQAVAAVKQSKERAKFGCYSLELTVDLIGNDPQQSKGEAFVDLISPPSINAPVNLEGVEITIWAYVPRKAAGDSNHPSGIQVFVKDREKRSEYGSWLNLTGNTDKWVPVRLTPSKEMPPDGHKDQGFDPTNLVAVGLKISAGTNSTATYSGPIYVDGVSW
jgi:serine/threonine protein kinase